MCASLAGNKPGPLSLTRRHNWGNHFSNLPEARIFYPGHALGSVQKVPVVTPGSEGGHGGCLVP